VSFGGWPTFTFFVKVGTARSVVHGFPSGTSKLTLSVHHRRYYVTN